MGQCMNKESEIKRFKNKKKYLNLYWKRNIIYRLASKHFYSGIIFLNKESIYIKKKFSLESMLLSLRQSRCRRSKSKCICPQKMFFAGSGELFLHTSFKTFCTGCKKRGHNDKIGFKYLQTKCRFCHVYQSIAVPHFFNIFL